MSERDSSYDSFTLLSYASQTDAMTDEECIALIEFQGIVKEIESAEENLKSFNSFLHSPPSQNASQSIKDFTQYQIKTYTAKISNLTKQAQELADSAVLRPLVLKLQEEDHQDQLQRVRRKMQEDAEKELENVIQDWKIKRAIAVASYMKQHEGTQNSASHVTPASISQTQPNTKTQKNVQRKENKIGEYAGLIFVLAAVLFFIAVIVLQPPQKQQPKLQEPTRSTTPKELTIPQVPTATTIPKVEETEGKALIERPIPKNGAILKFPMETRVAPLSITTKGTGYYYFVLEKLGTDSACMSFFVHAGESIDLDVPLGAYKLYYASGTTWYGKNDMFGEDSVLKCCDDVLAFWEDQDGYSGWDITLYPVAGGNMDTSYVSEDEFPKP